MTTAAPKGKTQSLLGLSTVSTCSEQLFALAHD